jgi:HSP20 family protein
MMSAAGHTGLDYPLNLYETDEAYVLELAVPGMSAENIDLNMEGRHVTIHAQMPQEDEGGRCYFVRGISQEEVRQICTCPATSTARTSQQPSPMDC